MTFAIKAMLQTDLGCGAKLVIDNDGKIITYQRERAAHVFKKQLEQRHDQPIICNFAVVDLNDAGWLSNNLMYNYRKDCGYRGAL